MGLLDTLLGHAGEKNVADIQDDLAQELGIQPGSSGHKASDEGIFLAQHARWAQLMAPVDQEGGQ